MVFFRLILLIAVWRSVDSEKGRRELQNRGCGKYNLDLAKATFFNVKNKLKCGGAAGGGKCSFLFSKFLYKFYSYDSSTQECHCFRPGAGQTFEPVAPDSNGDCEWFSNVVGDFPLGGCACGDPHIIKWGGEKYSFHGECDLVYVHAPHFGNNNTALDIHVRTTIQEHFSFVEEVAIKHKDTTVHVEGNQLFVGGKPRKTFPLSEAGFEIYRFTKTNRVNNTEGLEEEKKSVTYKINIEDRETLRVTAQGKMLFVRVSGKRSDMGTSVGLMGEYGTGKLLGRDRVSEFTNVNEFGMEWQVRPSEEMLFRTKRDPQLPHTKCRLPSEAAQKKKRGLLEDPTRMKKAMEACSKVSQADFDSCVEDVSFTGDVSLAEAYLM